MKHLGRALLQPIETFDAIASYARGAADPIFGLIRYRQGQPGATSDITYFNGSATGTAEFPDLALPVGTAFFNPKPITAFLKLARDQEVDIAYSEGALTLKAPSRKLKLGLVLPMTQPPEVPELPAVTVPAARIIELAARTKAIRNGAAGFLDGLRITKGTVYATDRKVIFQGFDVPEGLDVLIGDDALAALIALKEDPGLAFAETKNMLLVSAPAWRARFSFPKLETDSYPDVAAVLRPALDPEKWTATFRFNSAFAEALEYIEGFASNAESPILTLTFPDHANCTITASGLSSALDSSVTVPIDSVTGAMPERVRGLLRSWIKIASFTDTFAVHSNGSLLCFLNAATKTAAITSAAA